MFPYTQKSNQESVSNTHICDGGGSMRNDEEVKANCSLTHIRTDESPQFCIFIKLKIVWKMNRKKEIGNIKNIKYYMAFDLFLQILYFSLQNKIFLFSFLIYFVHPIFPIHLIL